MKVLAIYDIEIILQIGMKIRVFVDNEPQSMHIVSLNPLVCIDKNNIEHDVDNSNVYGNIKEI